LNVLVPLSTEAKARAEANVRQVRENPDPFFMINQSDENPIARDLLKALGHPPSSILGISLAISGQFVGAVLLIAAGSDRFNAHHAKLFATLKEPFFVAMSNALKHREVLKLKDLLADDNRFLQGELRRISGDEIVGANFGLKPVMYPVQQVATLDSPVLILG
jgi:transcriptional regulator with GAF, ATPase, and Fis domain